MEVAGDDIFLEAMKKDEGKKTKKEASGEVRKGRIVSVNATDVFIDTGDKAECVIPLAEFDKKPEIDDEIEVVIKELKEGIFIASKKDAEKASKIRDIKKAYKNGLPVMGTIMSVIKKDNVPKGFEVNLGGTINAFLPLKHIDTRSVEDVEAMKGKKYEFAILEYDDRRQNTNITVSRREYLGKMIKKMYYKFFDEHKVDDVLTATVDKIESNYAILLFEGVSLFLHISNFSWKHLASLSNVLNVGDEFDVKVLEINKSKNSIKVGVKQLTPDPWENIANKFSIGQLVKGSVVGYKRNGAFIEIEDGVDAFISNDEMSWTERVHDPKKFLKHGDIVEGKIIYVDDEKKKIDISLREIQENPWDNARKTYSEGSKVFGEVTSILDFGVFIKFEDGIEGLLRKEDVDWMTSDVDLKNKFKKGQKVEVMIVSIDPRNEKLRLGMKQMSENPFKLFVRQLVGASIGNIKLFEKMHRRDSVVTGEVIKINPSSAIIGLENELEGYVHISQISKEKIDKIEDVLKIGDKVNMVVKYIDANKNKIELSIKEYIESQDKRDVEQYMAEEDTVSTTLSMGSLIKDQLANFKLEKKNEQKKSSTGTKSK